MKKKNYTAPELEITAISTLSIISTSDMYTRDKDADPNVEMLSKGRIGIDYEEDMWEEDY